MSGKGQQSTKPSTAPNQTPKKASGGPVLTLIEKGNTKANGAKGPAPQKPVVQPPPLQVRTAALQMKAQWNVGEAFVPNAVVTVSAGAFVTEMIEPAQPVFARAGDPVPVRIRVKGAGYQDCEAVGTVKVVKLPTTITWRKPEPVLLGTLLSNNELCARIEPAALQALLVYDPAPSFKLETARTETLTVSFAGNDTYEAASATVDLTVAATKTEQASATGAEDMRNGRGWNGPSTPSGRALLDAWRDDTDNLKTDGQALMATLKGMTAEELLDHMNGKVANVATDIFDQTQDAFGNDAKFPNKIYKFANGLQVRYKENGDYHNPGVPMFCIEGQTNAGGFSRSDHPEDVAFKVSEDEMPRCPGVPGAPNWIRNDPSDTVRDAYASGACARTHLKCKPKSDQQIQWPQPGPIASTAKLSATQLCAKAKSLTDPDYEADCTYLDKEGKAVEIGTRLPYGDQPVTAIAAATKRYNEKRETLTITVTRQTQTIAWEKPADIEIGEKMNAGKTKRLNAVAKTKVSYTDNAGKTVIDNSTYDMTCQLTITAIAEGSANFEPSPPVSHTIEVKFPKTVPKNQQPKKKGTRK